MKAELLKKVPWKKVLKVAGATALGVSSMMSAYDTDKNVQKVVKMAASKIVTKCEK